MSGYWIPNKNGGMTYIRTSISCPEKYGEVADGTWQKEQDKKEQDKKLKK